MKDQRFSIGLRSWKAGGHTINLSTFMSKRLRIFGWPWQSEIGCCHAWIIESLELTALYPLPRDPCLPSGYCSRRLPSYDLFRHTYSSNTSVSNDSRPWLPHKDVDVVNVCDAHHQNRHSHMPNCHIRQDSPWTRQWKEHMFNGMYFRAHWSLNFLLNRTVSVELVR